MQVKHYIFRKSMFVLHWHRWIWGFPDQANLWGNGVWQRLADSSHGGNQCWWWRWWETMATRTYWLQPAGPNMPEYIVSVHLYVHLCPVMCYCHVWNPQIWKEPWVQDTQVECVYIMQIKHMMSMHGPWTGFSCWFEELSLKRPAGFLKIGDPGLLI